MTLDELNAMARAAREKREAYRKSLCVCCGASCLSSGGQEVLQSLRREAKNKGVDGEIEIKSTGCMGPCNQGPLVRITPDETIYQKLTPESGSEVLHEHILRHEPLPQHLLFSDVHSKVPINTNEDPFFLKQHKIVLENCGRIDPESLEDYVRCQGYSALAKALAYMQPEEVIAEIKHSRLRGRGGAGFPTGIKWETVYKYVSDQKYIICNGDEGDPGAFMDRSILEGDPHRVIEGMILAGYAVGASHGYAYLRGEYPMAISRLEKALKQARKNGLLGRHLFGSDFSFDIEIRIGAGAFVCGEETALIASIEGLRGTPRPRPPYPAESGLWRKPTLINNVETLANIAPIILKGGEWFSELGTPKSAGTKVFALAGKIRHSGLVEVPMGTPLREIIFDIGGGIPDGKKFKAAQTGGPSGGCIPEQHLDTPVDYESLVSLGSIMGSGGLIVMDESSDMVDVARYFMDFCVDESCGKCVPCRVGTKQMFDLLTKVCEGRASDLDLELLEELAQYMKDTSLCGLGISAPNPFLSTLRYFQDEYAARIVPREGAQRTANP